MVKSEVIKQLYKKYPTLNHSQIQNIVNIMFDTIKDSLINNKSVELRDFGRFSIKTIKAKYNARNPKTGEVIYVPKKNKVRFRASKKFKKFLNK